MTDKEYSEYKVGLARAIHDAFVAKKLKNSKEWKLIIEACEHEVKNDTHKLIYGNLTDPIEIARIQERIKLRSNFLPGILNFLNFKGETAIKEANDNELSLDDLF